MGLSNLVRSRGYRNFMAKLYGWGASLVILGALFKINHYPGADYMLILGMGTEAIIFFFSAFEPPHVEPDWSMVYPQLTGMYHGMKGKKAKIKAAPKKPTEELDNMLEKAKIGPELIESLGSGLRNLSENASKLSDISDAAVATNEYTERVKGASKSVEELDGSYKKTSDALNKDLEATEAHFSNIKNASESANGLSGVYQQAKESLQSNLTATNSFSGSINAAAKSAEELANKYNESADKISKTADSLDFTGIETKDYNTQLKKISENLSALNAVYELQLQSSNENIESTGKLQTSLAQFLSSMNESVDNTSKYQENLAKLNELFEKQIQGGDKQFKSTEQLSGTIDQFLANLNSSVDKTAQYKEQIEQLTENVAALNKVYGNMLSAMNIQNK